MRTAGLVGRRTLVVVGICGIVSAGTQVTAAADPPRDSANLFALQQQMQRQAQLAALLSRIQQARHDTVKAIIQNIR